MADRKAQYYFLTVAYHDAHGCRVRETGGEATVLRSRAGDKPGGPRYLSAVGELLGAFDVNYVHGPKAALHYFGEKNLWLTSSSRQRS